MEIKASVVARKMLEKLEEQPAYLCLMIQSHTEGICAAMYPNACMAEVALVKSRLKAYLSMMEPYGEEMPPESFSSGWWGSLYERGGYHTGYTTHKANAEARKTAMAFVIAMAERYGD